MGNPDAPRGNDEKYARRELERRFLLAALPSGRRPPGPDRGSVPRWDAAQAAPDD
jgi:hypothetical protein